MFLSRRALTSAITAGGSFVASRSRNNIIRSRVLTANPALVVPNLRWTSSSSSSTSAAAAAASAGVEIEVPPPPTSSHPHKTLPGAKGSIIYTETDEAPALATYSLYPVVGKLARVAGVDVIPCDISLAGRVLGLWPEKLKPNQRVPDNLSYLGELVKSPAANIIKLPNISAPLNQLQDCISELRAKGYDVPIYPREPQSDEEQAVQDKYKSVMGSAVNPVLREGNSDRRVAPPVKAYAQKNPHRMVRRVLMTSATA